MSQAPEVLRRVLAQVNARARYQHEPAGRDCWQTPAQLYAAGTGDCEDFAIAYWAALRGTEPPPRLACLLFSHRVEPHMVCQAGDWTLDVLADRPYRLSERGDLVAIAYTLGEADGQPVGWANGSGPLLGFARWNDVWRRMQAAEPQAGTR